jgi:membrane peptidoglycan carboxypeptidase
MNKVAGGSLPAETWRNFMLAATRSMPVRPLPSVPPRPAAMPVANLPAPVRGLFEGLLGLFRPSPPPAPEATPSQLYHPSNLTLTR